MAQIVTDLAKKYPQFVGVKFRGLVEKYQHLQTRFAYDKAIFQNFDRMSKWFPIPYAKEVVSKHHRETYSEVMRQNKNLMPYQLGDTPTA